jgi:hypothetical protein
MCHPYEQPLSTHTGAKSLQSDFPMTFADYSTIGIYLRSTFLL